MELSEAIIIVKKAMDTYKGFEKLSGVLEMAPGLDKEIKKLEAEKSGLEKEIKEIKSQVEKHKEYWESEKKRIADLKKAEILRFSEEIQESSRKEKLVLDALKAETKHYREETEALKKSHESLMNSSNVELSEIQSKLKIARADLDKIKAKL